MNFTLSKRLSNLEQKRHTTAGLPIIVWGDEAEPANPHNQPIMRVRWVGAEDGHIKGVHHGE